MKTFLIYHVKQTSYHCMHNWRSFRTSKLTPKVSGLKYFKVHEHTKIQFLEKIKWNSKIYPMRTIKILLLYHLKQKSSWQSMHKWRSFRTSNFTLMLSGLNFFQLHKRTKIQFLEKIKWNSKIYRLRIIKTLLLYHLKQISWQSIHKWSFRTSKFTPKVSGLKFFSKSTSTLKSD